MLLLFLTSSLKTLLLDIIAFKEVIEHKHLLYLE